MCCSYIWSHAHSGWLTPLSTPSLNHQSIRSPESPPKIQKAPRGVVCEPYWRSSEHLTVSTTLKRGWRLLSFLLTVRVRVCLRHKFLRYCRVFIPRCEGVTLKPGKKYWNVGQCIVAYCIYLYIEGQRLHTLNGLVLSIWKSPITLNLYIQCSKSRNWLPSLKTTNKTVGFGMFWSHPFNLSMSSLPILGKAVLHPGGISPQKRE